MSKLDEIERTAKGVKARVNRLFGNRSEFRELLEICDSLEQLVKVAKAAKEMHAKVWPVAANPGEVTAAVALMQALAELEAP